MGDPIAISERFKLRRDGADVRSMRCEMMDDAEDGRRMDALAAALLAGFLDLGPVRLSDEERKHLGSVLFVGVGQFVLAAALGLSEAPHLFPGGAELAVRLRRRQRRALFWSALAVQLERLTRMARDSYLHEQGQAFLEASALIGRLRHAAADPALSPADRGPGSLLAQQYQALLPALLILKKVGSRRSGRAGPRPATPRKPRTRRQDLIAALKARLRGSR